ncbi:hypothetical protein PO909_030002 [Leuciscus waleckii]
MAFIKEESEDVEIEETFRVQHEDTETQTGRLMWTDMLRSHDQTNTAFNLRRSDFVRYYDMSKSNTDIAQATIVCKTQ